MAPERHFFWNFFRNRVPRRGAASRNQTWGGRPRPRRTPGPALPGSEPADQGVGRGPGATLLFLRRRRRLGLVVHHVAIFDGGPAFVVFVVLVFHHHANAHVIPVFEVQRVVGARVGREPVLAVDLLAVGFEFGELVVGAFPDHAHAFAVSLHDLQVPVVHPSLALEVPLALDRFLGLDGEDIAADLVHLLAAQVVDIIFGNLRGGHDERLHIPQILLVLGGQQDIAERYDRRINHFLHALAFRRENDIFHQLPLPTRGVPAAV